VSRLKQIPRFSMPGMPMSIKPIFVRSNTSRRCSTADVESRSASSIMINSTILSRETKHLPSLVGLPCCLIQISTREVSRSRSLRSSRRVPPTVGVWKTVRERANAAYTVSSEGSRGPQVCSSGSARSQLAWRRAESVLPTPAGPTHNPIVRCVRIAFANSVNRRCSLVAMKGPVQRPRERAVRSYPRDRYIVLAKCSVSLPPLSSVAGCFVPDPEESRQLWPSVH